MKHLFLLPAFLLFSHTIVFSQGCLPEGITFTAQEEIDNFQINYPGCTEIEGDVEINGNDISNINGLNLVTFIGGWLKIYQNPILNNLSGLESLTSVGLNIWIYLNSTLTNLSGLENLTSIEGALYISGNDMLIDLSGMESLNNIGDDVDIGGNPNMTNLTGLENLTFVGGFLFITDNDALTNLTGLENLTSIGGDLSISDNFALTSLYGLENLTSIEGDIAIVSNASLTNLYGLDNIDAESILHLYFFYNVVLSDCDVQSICDFLANQGTNEINDNSPGCNSEAEVEAACLTSTEDNIAKEELTLFPNPATSFITIHIKEGIAIEETIFFNHLGQKVQVAVPVNNTVDVSGLKPGIYFIEVAAKDWRGRTKLIIE